MDNWLHNEILDGLSKLLCLSLERTPASDLIAGTAGMWVETLTDDMAWERERDTPRIRKAFATLARTRTTWPAPLHFREALPPVEVRAIGYEVKPVSPEVAAANLERLRREIADVVKPMPSAPVERTKDLGSVEAGLKQHYGSRRP